MNKRLRNALIDCIGAATTVLCIVIIYFILFVDGDIKEIGKSVIIQAASMAVLTLLVKNFWYLSAENHIRNGAKYLETKTRLLDRMDEVIVDRYDFDIFIANENINNYNLFVDNHCRGLTPGNYKPHWWYRFINRLRPLFGITPKSNAYYLQKYTTHIEHRATKLHKLSASNILTLSPTYNGLNDDRNSAGAHKISYLISSTLVSLCTTILISLIGFHTKENFDKFAAIVTMLLYCVNILFAILQTLLKAVITVSKDDMDYFSRISNIIEKYENYKANPVIFEKVTYNYEEFENAGLIDTAKENKVQSIDGTSGEIAKPANI